MLPGWYTTPLSQLCSTGVPQGTALAPFLFTLYTADFSHNASSCHLQKSSVDSAAVALITGGDDRKCRRLTVGFVDLWNHPIRTWVFTSTTDHTDTPVRRGKGRMFPLRKLKPFGVQGPLVWNILLGSRSSTTWGGPASLVTPWSQQRWCDTEGWQLNCCPWGATCPTLHGTFSQHCAVTGCFCSVWRNSAAGFSSM